MNIGPVYAIMSKYRVALFLLLFCLFYTFALLWGIKKDLPIAFEADESIYVLTAIEMASTGELDPGWYGNPGSTTFYPLTLIFHFWNYIQWNGALLKAAPNLRDTFANNGAEFYLLGRYLSVLFAVMSVPIIYRVGCKWSEVMGHLKAKTKRDFLHHTITDLQLHVDSIGGARALFFV